MAYKMLQVLTSDTVLTSSPLLQSTFPCWITLLSHTGSWSSISCTPGMLPSQGLALTLSFAWIIFLSDILKSPALTLKLLLQCHFFSDGFSVIKSQITNTYSLISFSWFSFHHRLNSNKFRGRQGELFFLSFFFNLSYFQLQIGICQEHYQWLNKGISPLTSVEIVLLHCWPSTPPEGVQGGVKHSVLQGIWWNWSLDS